MQCHFIAMYAPSLFLKKISQRFGKVTIVFLGALFLLFSVLSGISFHGLCGFILSLIFLGVGWNFSFLGSTVLLQETFDFKSRIKYQSINDFLIFAFNAVACLFSGALLLWIHWVGLNILCIILVLIMFFSLLSVSINNKKSEEITI